MPQNREVEAGESEAEGHPGLHETMSATTTKRAGKMAQQAKVPAAKPEFDS